MRDFPLVVYGATGYSGRLICLELVRAGQRFAIAGRQRAKLEALQRELASSGAAGNPPEILIADVADPAGLAKVAGAAQVLLNCVGPFMSYGPPVVEAALSAGTHYLDITGEYPFMLATYRKHEEAKRRDVLLCNSVGFDVIPTDVAAVLAATAYESEGLGRKQLLAVDIAFAYYGTQPSRGTARSMLMGAASGNAGSAAYVGGVLVAEALGAHVWEAPLPPPLGSQPCISLPWGDVATAPRSTGAPDVRCFTMAPRRAAKVLPWVRPLLPLLGKPPLRGLIERAILRMPEGPSDEQRQTGGSGVCAQARFEGGRSATAWLKLPEGYTLTAIMAALCARLCTRPDFAARGALTPTQAFGVRTLLDGMIAAGGSWGVQKS